MSRLKSDYFDDDWDNEEVAGSVATDRTGEKISAWTIVKFVGPGKNIYLVRCDCGLEFIRNIYGIITHQSERCKRCNVKSRTFFGRKLGRM